MKQEYSTYGRQVIVDIKGVKSSMGLMLYAVQAVRKAGATILSREVNTYENRDGRYITIFSILLSESHFSCRYDIESGDMLVDCYTCGETVDPQVAIDLFLSRIKYESSTQVKLVRGIENTPITVN